MKKRYWEARNLVIENKMFAGLTLDQALKLQTELKINKFLIEKIYNEYRDQEKLDALRDVKANLDLGYERGKERLIKNKAL